jgi:hypothetical protein
MRKTALALGILFTMASVSTLSAQTTTQKVGHEVKEDYKDAKHGVKHESHKVAHNTKQGYKHTRHDTKQGYKNTRSDVKAGVHAAKENKENR